MGKQQKLKQARRRERLLRGFLLDVQDICKTYPDLKILWDNIIALRSIHAPQDKIAEATAEFSKAYSKIKFEGGEHHG